MNDFNENQNQEDDNILTRLWRSIYQEIEEHHRATLFAICVCMILMGLFSNTSLDFLARVCISAGISIILALIVIAVSEDEV